MFGPKTTKHKNITRIDHPPKRTYGYNVRIAWKGQKYGKFFSDRLYGDRLAALDAAIEWRNTTEKAIGKPRTEHQVVGWNSRNTSGHIGIRRVKSPRAEQFSVTWMAYGDRTRPRETSFSITKHGEKKALKLAMRARQRGEQLRWHSPRVVRPAKPAYTPWLPPV